MDPSTRQAFEEGALTHLDTLYRVALRLTREDAAAEDLVQDTLVRAYRFWHQFKPGTSARAWLLTILRNTFNSEYRRSQRARERETTLHSHADAVGDTGAVGLGDAPPAPDHALAAKIDAEEVRAALAEIAEDFRLAVVLADIEGLTYREIAEVMGCPTGTVMSRLYRGRRQLKKILRRRQAAASAPQNSPLSLDAYRQRARG